LRLDDVRHGEGCGRGRACRSGGGRELTSVHAISVCHDGFTPHIRDDTFWAGWVPDSDPYSSEIKCRYLLSAPPRGPFDAWDYFTPVNRMDAAIRRPKKTKISMTGSAARSVPAISPGQSGEPAGVCERNTISATVRTRTS